MTNSAVLKLPHLEMQAFQATNHENLEKFCGQPDCVNGVEKLEKEYGSCYGGTLRPAWDFLGNSQRVSPTIGDVVWGIGLVNTMVYLVYCSYYLVPVTTSSIPSLHWIYDTMIRELEPQRLGVLWSGDGSGNRHPKTWNKWSQPTMDPSADALGRMAPGVPAWAKTLTMPSARLPWKTTCQSPSAARTTASEAAVQGSNRPCGQEKWNVQYSIIYRSICRYVACAHGYAHAYMHTCIRAYMHTCIHEMTRVYYVTTG